MLIHSDFINIYLHINSIFKVNLQILPRGFQESSPYLNFLVMWFPKVISVSTVATKVAHPDLLLNNMEFWWVCEV
jgi:hypothetical protein